MRTRRRVDGPRLNRRYVILVDGFPTVRGPEPLAREALEKAIAQFGADHVEIRPETEQ